MKYGMTDVGAYVQLYGSNVRFVSHYKDFLDVLWRKYEESDFGVPGSPVKRYGNRKGCKS